MRRTILPRLAAQADASAIAKAAAFNAVSDKTGVTAVVNRTSRTIRSVNHRSGCFRVRINGVAITGFTSVAGDTSANRQRW